MRKVDTLPNARRPAPLGKPGEQPYATRFLGSRAFLVTYRLTDPLYVVDLSDPADPKDKDELAAVTGVGARKLESYGEVLLRTVAGV